VKDRQPPTRPEAIREDVPDWWPHAAEFPRWHVWRGVCGLLYARRPRTSPPVVLRSTNAADLRDQIRRAEGRIAEGIASLASGRRKPRIKSLMGRSSSRFAVGRFCRSGQQCVRLRTDADASELQLELQLRMIHGVGAEQFCGCSGAAN